MSSHVFAPILAYVDWTTNPARRRLCRAAGKSMPCDLRLQLIDGFRGEHAGEDRGEVLIGFLGRLAVVHSLWSHNKPGDISIIGIAC